jgi:hypothetical protein
VLQNSSLKIELYGGPLDGLPYEKTVISLNARNGDELLLPCALFLPKMQRISLPESKLSEANLKGPSWLYRWDHDKETFAYQGVLDERATEQRTG